MTSAALPGPTPGEEHADSWEAFVHAVTQSQHGETASFTEWLRQEAGNVWKDVVCHPFTDQLADATVDEAIMKRYLIQDHRFLDAFVVLLASMVAKAPCLEDRIPGCQFLALITGKENTYFERSFTALGVTTAERAETPNAPVTTAFACLMQNTAKSDSFAEMLAVLVVAEWSYLSWGERVVHRCPPAQPFWCKEWIDLHSGPGFQDVVAYLRRLLDIEGPQLSLKQRAACRDVFVQAVALEKDFFDMAMGLGP